MKIGFIGFGNMASAMADGWIYSQGINPENLYACAKHYDRLLERTNLRKMNACHDAQELVRHVDIVILAVKPYMIEEVILEIKDLLKDKIVISVAAGWNYERYQPLFVEGTAFISTIPNTPVSIGEGIIVCENRHTLNASQLECFQHVFSHLGLVEFVEEKQLSIAGTIAGCGPAFASLFIEALGDAGNKYGLSRDTAYRLASQMIAGTGKMQVITGKHPGVLKDEVCSPAGTTIKGVCKLEENGFRNAVIKAIDEIEG